MTRSGDLGRDAENGIVRVEVYGTPAPQGSKRHVGRGIMVESSAKVKPWREAVKAAVLDQTGAGAALDGTLSVEVVFRLPRPRGHYRTGRNAALLRDGAPAWPGNKPDVDKLLRSTLDALTDVGLWRDDSQVTHLRAVKRYVTEGYDAPGASIQVARTALQ